MLTHVPNRRRRPSEPEHREGRRERADHRLRADTESIAGPGAESGFAQGVEGRHDLSLRGDGPSSKGRAMYRF